MASGSRRLGSARWSAAGNELRRSSVTSSDVRTCVADASTIATARTHTDGSDGLGAQRHARMQPDGGKRREAEDRRDGAQDKARGQQPLLEAAQRLRQRQARDPFQQARLAGEREVEHPGADGERERR